MKHDDTIRLNSKQRQFARMLGMRLAMLRAVANMTQEEAALRAGLSRPTVARLEADASTRTLSQLMRYLDALSPGASMESLITGSIPALQSSLDHAHPKRVRKSNTDEKALDF